VQQTPHIRFQKTRDFGAKLNVTFEFIRQNFKALITSMLYIAGPAIILFGVFNGYYQKYALDFTQIVQGNTIFSNEIFITLGGMIIFGVISQLLIVTIILEFVNLYNEKLSTDISVDEVWSSVKLSLGKVVGSTLIFVIAFIVFLGILGFMMAAVGVSGGTGGVGLIIFIMFLVVPVMVYVGIALSIFFNTMLHEKHPVSEFGFVFKRCFYLVKTKWWSTFGLVIVSGILRSVMAVVFSLPMMGVLVFSAFNTINGQEAPQSMWYDIILILSSILAMLGSYLLQSIPVLALTFQYFNLVELKDATGLIGEIDSLGTTESKEDIEETY